MVTEQETNLEKLEKFFTYDNEVKMKLYQAGNIPTGKEDELISYTDTVWKITTSIGTKLKDICDLFGIDIVTPTIDSFITECKNRIATTNYSVQDLQLIYNDLFAKMNEETVNLIQENIFGYSDHNVDDLNEIIKKCSSYNEILHAIHSYVVRNEDILQSISEIKSTPLGNDENIKIALRGDPNPFAEDIYNKLVEQNTDISKEAKMHAVGITDVIAINESNKILIMVRDKGHSLTIESKMEADGNFGVEYYMPKPVSYEIMSQLHGINNYHEGDPFAVGSFLTSPDFFVNDIVDLINGVPTDANLSLNTNETMHTYLESQGHHK